MNHPSAKPQKYSQVPELIIVVIILSVYLLNSTPIIELPGMHVDEGFKAVPAIHLLLGRFSEGPPPITNAFELTLSGHPFPLMIAHYHGAAYSYFLIPFLWLCGISIKTIRLTSIFVGLVIIVITYVLGRKLFGKTVAILSCLLLATDPTYIFHIRIDDGQVALPILLQLLSLYELVQWWKTRKLPHYLAALLLLGLGLYERANVAWFIVALLLTGLSLDHRRLLNKLRPLLLPGIACFSLGAALFIFYNLRTAGNTFSPLMKPFRNIMYSPEKKSFIPLVFDNNLLMNRLERLRVFLVGQDHPQSTFLHNAMPNSHFDYLLAAAMALLVVPCCFQKTPGNRKLAFIPLLLLIMVGQICLTPLTIFSHHWIMTYPFCQLVCALALVRILDRIVIARRLYFIPVFFILCILYISVVLHGQRVIGMTYRVFEQRTVLGTYSVCLEDVARYVEGKTVVPLDAGLGADLIVLTHGRVKIIQPVCSSDSAYLAAFLRRTYRSDALYLLRSPKATNFIGMRENFFTILNEDGHNAIMVKMFYEINGEHIYSLYAIK